MIHADRREMFADLWDSTGGAWDSNPWVWVISSVVWTWSNSTQQPTGSLDLGNKKAPISRGFFE